MGRVLCARSSAAKSVFARADAALGYGLTKLCLDGPEETLTSTEFAQPALLAHAVASFEAVRAEEDVAFAAAAGHSLGEWSAYVAAGAIGFEDAVRLVRLRGRLMQRAVPLGEGAMTALLGLDEANVRAACAAAADIGVVAPATFNGSGHIVISGATDAVAKATEVALETGAMKAIPLSVSAPFHSPLMAPARDELARALASVEVQAPAFPVYSNIDAVAPSTPDAIRASLVEQLIEPVRWDACLSAMRDAGVDRFTVLGTGHALARMVKRLRLGPSVEYIAEEG